MRVITRSAARGATPIIRATSAPALTARKCCNARTTDRPRSSRYRYSDAPIASGSRHDRRGQGGMLDRHHDAVRAAQAPQARDARTRRQSELHRFVAARRAHFPREPDRIGFEATLLHLRREAGEPRQRIFDARRDETARAAHPADQPLLDEQRDRLARRDPRHTDAIRQRALGRQRFTRGPRSRVNRGGETGRELQIQRRAVLRVRGQFSPAFVHKNFLEFSR